MKRQLIVGFLCMILVILLYNIKKNTLSENDTNEVHTFTIEEREETPVANVISSMDIRVANTIQLVHIALPTPTLTPVPTNTPTPVPTATPTPTSTPTPTPTVTPKPTVTLKPAATATPTPAKVSGRYYKYPTQLSAQDIRDMAALVFLEVGGQSYKCKLAVASVIINLSIQKKLSIHATMFNARRFSPANRISRTIPSEECIKAVNDVLTNGTTMPLSVTAFRNKHYHRFGTPYCVIDKVYFSTV